MCLLIRLVFMVSCLYIGICSWTVYEQGSFAELGISNKIGYYNIGTDTDTEWRIPDGFFGIFEFSAPIKSLHNKYVR